MDDANVQEFCRQTGQTEAVAKAFLSQHNTVDAAVQAFREDARSMQSSSHGASRFTTMAAMKSGSGPSSSSSRGFATLGSLGGGNDDDDDDDDRPNTYFAGGHQSGVAVEGGSGRDAAMRRMMQEAEKRGVSFEQYMREEAQRRKDANKFQGQGHTLGDEEQAPQAVGVPLAQQKETGPRKVKVVVWKNGISVDDGEETPTLRPLDPTDPFVMAISRGVIPPQLAAKYGGEIDLELMDRRGEEFKQESRPFGGTGHRLGNPTSDEEAQATPASSSSASSAAKGPTPSSKAAAQNVTAEDMKPPVDDSKPKTRLQIRLADGNRMVTEFNTTSTINDVMAFITMSGHGDKPYVLMSSFPRKALTDVNQTLEEAGVCNAVVIQKWEGQ